MNIKINRGFTLIELIVVIAIIAILSAIVVVNVSGFIRKTKYARAKAEVGNFKTALNEFYIEYGHFPGDQSSGMCFVTPGQTYQNCAKETPYWQEGLVKHYISEFYKIDFIGGPKYFGSNAVYALSISDTNSDGIADCAWVIVAAINEFYRESVLCSPTCSLPCGSVDSYLN